MDGMAGQLGRSRDLGQDPTVRAKESKLAVRLSIELVALLVDGAMVPATEQRKIRERGGASIGPVTDVMALAEAHPAAREATAAVAMVKRAPYRGRDRAGPGRDLDRAAGPAVLHGQAARVARQAPGRFRGNVRAVLEQRPFPEWPRESGPAPWRTRALRWPGHGPDVAALRARAPRGRARAPRPGQAPRARRARRRRSGNRCSIRLARRTRGSGRGGGQSRRRGERTARRSRRRVDPASACAWRALLLRERLYTRVSEALLGHDRSRSR